jgi:putative spermidine/putrescine transport system permease protein
MGAGDRRLFMSPLIVPGIAIGLGILLLISLIGLPPSMETLIAGHTVVGVPFVLRTTIASLSQVDPALLQASASLGLVPSMASAASPCRSSLPASRPEASWRSSPRSIMFRSRFFLADARSPVLPIRLWQMIQADLDPRVASISAVIVVFTLVLMLAMERIAGLSRQLAR